MSKDGEEVLSESRSLVFKSLKVRRLVDPEGESVVYAVFSQRLDKKEDANNSRFKSALCAVRSPHRTSQQMPPSHHRTSLQMPPSQQMPPSHRRAPTPALCMSQVHVDKFETAGSTQ